MASNRSTTIWLLLISGVILTLLFNWSLFSYLIDQLSGTNLPAPKSPLTRIQVGAKLFQVLFQLLLFWILSLGNYLGHQLTLFAHRSAARNTLLWTMANLLVFLLAGLVEQIGLINLFPKMVAYINLKHLNDLLLTNSIASIGGISAGYLALLLEKLGQQEAEKARLQEEKVQAELTALKDQISPHFFFNALSSLSTLVRHDQNGAALDFIQELSHTYRYILASSQKDLVTVQEELDFLEAYLSLLNKRFGDKLIVHLKVPVTARSAYLPPMSLQLLVENAVQHNVMTKTQPLTIRFYVSNDHLIVENNRHPNPEAQGLGMGLPNLANRFQLLAKANIDIEQDRHHFRVKLPLL